MKPQRQAQPNDESFEAGPDAWDLTEEEQDELAALCEQAIQDDDAGLLEDYKPL